MNNPTVVDCCRKLTWFVMIVPLGISLIGCHVFDQFHRSKNNMHPTVFSQSPTKEQLIAHIQDQSKAISQLQSDVRVSVDGMPTLRGNLAAERPNRLRLTAGLLGVNELGVDVGSNDQLFWFWSKAGGSQEGIYFARHDQYQTSPLHHAIPLEPMLLLDALGLFQIRQDERVEGPFMRPLDGRIELRLFGMAGNQPRTRILAIDPKRGWIVQQSIYDAQGRLLAYANSTGFRHYSEQNVSLPEQVRVTAYPAQGDPLKLVIDLGQVRINSLFGDPEQLWVMPAPANVPQIDLINGLGKIETATADEPDFGYPRGFDHLTATRTPLARQLR